MMPKSKTIIIQPKILLAVLYGCIVLFVTTAVWCEHVVKANNAIKPIVKSQPIKLKPKVIPDQHVTVAPTSLQSLGVAAQCSNNTIMNVVAHQDDDLLFMSPDLLHDIASKRCIRSVYLTAGDAGQPYHYWRSREKGIEAAYAYMYGVPNLWHEDNATINGHQVRVSYLDEEATVSLVFMRLPDGKPSGKGFISDNNESLHYLMTDQLTIIHSIDHVSEYTSSGLTDTLLAIMNLDQPSEIHTLNPNNLNDGDHSDHHATGYFTHVAWRNYSKISTIQSYKGYPIAELPANIKNKKDVTMKQQTFLIYIQNDPNICPINSCITDNSYQRYIPRQYSTAN